MTEILTCSGWKILCQCFFLHLIQHFFVSSNSYFYVVLQLTNWQMKNYIQLKPSLITRKNLLISGIKRHDVINPVLASLHWLPISFRIQFKCFTCCHTRLTWPGARVYQWIAFIYSRVKVKVKRLSVLEQSGLLTLSKLSHSLMGNTIDFTNKVYCIVLLVSLYKHLYIVLCGSLLMS